MRKNARQYRHNKHSIGSATVHLVWIPKRRKPVLVGEVKLRLSQIMTEVANEKGSCPLFIQVSMKSLQLKVV